MALSMRSLLADSPFLPPGAREGIAEGHPDSREWLVEQGLNPCEAAELLDEPCAETACGQDE